ncbi:MAG: SdrD B-like domain-containing protein, partial [Saprospiraceae bacterium]|nr:SdrD B-like domain-containing protein [Saprospiraceae bacterium]
MKHFYDLFRYPPLGKINAFSLKAFFIWLFFVGLTLMPDVVRAQCTLDVTTSVGECIFNEVTNQSEVLVAVSAEWSNEPVGALIEVTFQGVTKTIDPATAGCPGYVQFIVPLVAPMPTIEGIMAQFTSGSCPVFSENVNLPAACPAVICSGTTSIGGRTFNDFDADGVRDASEFGLSGVTVKVFDCDNNEICSTVSGQNGRWVCTGLPAGAEVRVEFSDFPNGFFSGGIGADNAGGTVQFTTIGNCDVDFGLLDPATFCEDDPFVITPCYVRGDPEAGGSSGQADVLVAMSYKTPSNIYLARGYEIGSTWGVAYQKETKSLFASAVLKRHIGLASDGLGAIYQVDVSQLPAASPTGNASLYVNLDDYSINTGDEAMLNRNHVTLGLTGDVGDPSYDPEAFDRVGKWGLGDIDLSDDGTMLYAVNLYNRSLVIMEIGNPVQAVPASIIEIPIPDPGCSNADDWRPWGLKYKNGKLYVGGVCSAQTSQNTSDLSATIYEFDPILMIFSEILSFPLDYPKGNVLNGLSHCDTWNPWTDDFGDLPAGGIELCYPQPILSDIEFDVYGNMTIAFIDRAGHQEGWYDYGTNSASTATWKGNAGGDVLRVYNNNGTWLIEQNARAGFETTAGANNGEGPCNGEFYFEDAFGSFHEETVHGGLAIHPSNNELLLNVMDPAGAFSGGLAWYNNSTGAANRQYQVYFSGDNGNTGLFGKAAGLGDLELLCGEPTIQVGNYVWKDENANGIQDACELPLPGIKVSLYEKDGTFVSTTTTGTDGNYKFDNLDPDTQYIIAFGTEGQTTNGVIIIGEDVYIPTSANVNGNVQDKIDSDIATGDNTLPVVVQGLQVICFTTGVRGDNNHCYDAGFQDGGFDYGDLPSSFNNTLAADNGASHFLKEGLYLGSCVDFEIDGVEDAKAGVEGSGDDNTTGIFSEGTCQGDDDEDGIRLLSPMIPGSIACIEVTATSQNGTAILNAWMDFNGDGDFDTDEQITWLTRDGNAINSVEGTIPNGTGAYVLCFEVPTTATFEGGETHARFRLSMNGDLEPNGSADSGEVEDYWFPLGKAGNLVWEDYDFDGMQDANEPGLNGVTVALTWLGADGAIGGTGLNADITYPTVTTGGGNFQQGEYYFCGLIDGSYKIVATTPANMTPTKANQGSQTDGGITDNDGPVMDMILMMVMETFSFDLDDVPTDENGNGDSGEDGVNTFPDAQVDETHDFSFARLDYGDLPEDPQDEDFNTLMTNSGPVHVIIPGLSLNTTVDSEQDGNPSTLADGDGADEDGIEFITPLIAGYQACIEIDAINTTGEDAVIEGWIDWNGNGQLEAGEELTGQDFGLGGVIISGSVTDQVYCFNVPTNDVNYNDGMVFARFRLSPLGSNTGSNPGLNSPNGFGDKFLSGTFVPQGEVEDYKENVAKVGNLAWLDADFDGIQDDNEEGINNVKVYLIFLGENMNLETTFDANNLPTASGDDYVYETTSATIQGQDGLYYFCGLLENSKYKLVVISPESLTPTKPNQGGDNEVDSDFADGLDGDTEVGNVLSGMTMIEFQIGNADNQPTSENGLGDDHGTAPTTVLTFPDAFANQTFDVGFVPMDYGDLPNSFGITVLNDDDPAKHIIKPAFFLGSCVDAERNGNPDAEAGRQSGGDDNTGSAYSMPGGNTACTDDENGIRLITPMIPNNVACLEVTATTPAGALLYGWIDFNGDGNFDLPAEQVVFTKVNGANITPTTEAAVPSGSSTQLYCFVVPINADFGGVGVLQTHMRFRLTTQSGMSYDGCAPDGEVEDYYQPVAKIGDYTWVDLQDNGLQGDAKDEILSGVTVNIKTTDLLGNPYIATLQTDLNGMYMFTGLLPTLEYCLEFDVRTADHECAYVLIPTLSNVGAGANEATDSDVLHEDVKYIYSAGCYRLEEREYNPNVDAGFLPEPTIIAFDETLTLLSCIEGEVEALYSFNILGCDLEGFNPDLVFFDFNNAFAAKGITYVRTRYEDTGEKGLFFEYKLSGITPEDVMNYEVLIGYDNDEDGTITDREPNVEIDYQIISNQSTTNYENLSCRGEVNVTLNEQCSIQLSPNMLINGALVCDDDFEVHVVYVEGNRSYINEDGHISDPFIYHQNGGTYEKNLDKACIQYIYRVYHEGDLVCWGYVNAEDKSAPIFEYCPSDKFYGQRSSVVYEIVGELGDNDNDG